MGTRAVPAAAPSPGGGRPGRYVGALDQGTTSTRFMVFDAAGHEVARAQAEHAQVLPRPGWVEHRPEEIWDRTREVIAQAMAAAGLTAEDLVAVGLTNQRETTLLWDRRTGRPLGNALVWQDTRTQPLIDDLVRRGLADLVRRRSGLPPATYFSAGKLRWLLDAHADAVAAAGGHVVAGTVDSWLLWQLTGGPDGGVHVTDVTNASRTMLMDIDTLEWDAELLDVFGIDRELLPRIVDSTDPAGHGTVRTVPELAGVPVTAVLGDQQAAMVGQTCFAPGEAKNTYGTGNFLLLNTGKEAVRSEAGLLTTVCYRFAGEDPVYALEGSIAVTGSAVQWLRDRMRLIDEAAQIEELAAAVEDSAGAYFVPAFSGLFAPYWRPDARGTIVGLAHFHGREHLARATLDSICHQSADVAAAMEADSGVRLEVLRVDGGVTANALCMQIQADVLGVPVQRPAVAETTALGAAYAAGLAVGLWPDTDAVRALAEGHRTWRPEWDAATRERARAGWRRAVSRSLDWAGEDAADR
ncbi:glycerol kinase GlpK [Blastococcus sp. SYSU DS0619]